MATQATRPPWPRRAALATALLVLILGGAYWLLARQATLQALVQKIANASGGQVVADGVTGSLTGTMHFKHLIYRTQSTRITAENVDIVWSPWQVFTGGIVISQLKAASVLIEALGPSAAPTMPNSLALPFLLRIQDGRIARMTSIDAGRRDGFEDLRFALEANSQHWQLTGGRAATPWGHVALSARIGAHRPFALDATAAITEGQQFETKLALSGNLERAELVASAHAGPARADATATLAPFAAMPLRALRLRAHEIDPSRIDPRWPTANIALDVSAQIGADDALGGAFKLDNSIAAGTLDAHRLPLRSVRAQLKGSLSAARIDALSIDLGRAGVLTGHASSEGGTTAKPFKQATLALHTDGIDLHGIHATLKPTRIAGRITLGGNASVQVAHAQLAQPGMQVQADARLSTGILSIDRVRLSADTGRLDVHGQLAQDGSAVALTGHATHFNPAAFGQFPDGDLNARLSLQGAFKPAWHVSSELTFTPSMLFKQALGGSVILRADASHVSAARVHLTLGQNTINAHGNFGAPGEHLDWRVDAPALSQTFNAPLRSLAAHGTITGTFSAPRTTVEIDANGLGRAAPKRAVSGAVHASGEAWLDAARAPAFKGSGSVSDLDPSAFGAYPPGDVSARFDVTAQLGANWRAAVNLALEKSALSNSPLSGSARLELESQGNTHADLTLRLGANTLSARGALGAPNDQLEWRVDAPALAAVGAGFGGVLQASGSVAGTFAQPAFTLTLDGKDLALPGPHRIATVRANASLGDGPDAALTGDIEAGGYAGPSMALRALRLRASGTRAAHTLRASASDSGFDANAELRGGWNGQSWRGMLAALSNRGAQAFALQAPAPLNVELPNQAGAASATRLALSNAVLTLPGGSVTVRSLEKNGAHWRTSGTAVHVPLNYLVSISSALEDRVSGDLALGADWSLDLQGTHATGSLHLFRERGDLIVGADVQTALGLRLLDLRADLLDQSLRLQLNMDGARVGQTRIDAHTALHQGRIANDSALTVNASADMHSVAWLAPLFGQPGLELDGALKASISGSGTIGAPVLTGSLTGDQLAMRWPEHGVKLRNGQLRATLVDDRLLLQRLYFEGTEGHALADGTVRFSDAHTQMALKLTLDKLSVLARPDRMLALSATAALTRDATRFALEGRAKVERARIELAPEDRPVQSDDVIVLGKTGTASSAKKSSAGPPLTIDLEADLGSEFDLKGMGIDARLSGSLRALAGERRAPRLNARRQRAGTRGLFRRAYPPYTRLLITSPPPPLCSHAACPSSTTLMRRSPSTSSTTSPRTFRSRRRSRQRCCRRCASPATAF